MDLFMRKWKHICTVRLSIDGHAYDEDTELKSGNKQLRF